MPRQAAKTTRIEARMSEFGLEMVKRAAEIQGRSVSDFVVSAAEAAAKQTIEDTHVIRLTLEDQKAFAAALRNPPEPGPVWKRAVEAHRRLIKTSE